MLTVDEIKKFIDDDKTSEKKRFAKVGERYYDGDNDIKQYRLFYYNADGNLVEDKTRSNVKIPHLFFTELVDQAVQYILSGNRSGERIVLSDDPELQKHMDKYFNNNDIFMDELAECITDCKVKGFSYIYAYKDANDRYAFATADSMGVIEVREKDTDDGCAYVIYYYTDRIDKGHKVITRVQVWSEKDTTYYVMVDNGALTLDDSVEINPRPHILYKKSGGKEDDTYYESLGFIPFFRLDNNKKQHSSLRPIKPLIDDYDLMASSLSNNLIDFDTPLHVVKGYEGDNMDELQTNLKTKKIIGTGENGDVDIKTVDVPYQARKEKMELDEKNIYRFGMGLNTAGLKDTSATTNIAIKAAYSLLELQCNKLEIRLKKLLRHLVRIVIEEINKTEQKGYQDSDVYFKFEHVIMSNAQENAQIKLTEAQAHQVVINTIMSLADTLDDETIIKAICDELDIDYEEIKDKLPKDAEKDIADAKQLLDGVVTSEQGEKEVLQAQLNSEEEVIAQLKSTYEQALRDCEAKIQELSMRADLEPENLQSIIYQKQYQEAIKAQLEGALANLQSDSYATVSDYLTRSYQDGYLGSMYDMQGQGIPLVMPIDQEAVTRAVLLDSQLSTSLYDRMGEDVKAIKKAVRQEVSRGIAQGMTWSNIASNLARNMKHTPFQKAYNNSIRIARTEGHRIQNRATLDAQKRAIDRGAEVVKQWNAVLDGRTRSEHRELDGQIREVDEMFEVAGYKAEAPGLFGDPSQDCNCRCCLDQRARWALNCGIVKMDNFSKETVAFESPEEYAEWKKVYWSDENIAYMQHVTAMEKKYGKNFEKMLNSMTDKEYEKYKRLLDNNPMYKPVVNQSTKINFKPATTIDEAEEYAQKFFESGYSPTFKGQAVYKGISIEHANEINKTLEEIYSQYEIPKLNGIKAISPTSAKGKKIFSSDDAVAAYNPAERGIFINKKILNDAKALEIYNKNAENAWDIVMDNIDMLTGRQLELAERYKRAGRQIVGDGSVRDYIIHEMGHHAQWTMISPRDGNAIGDRMGKYAPHISGYANASRGEYIAESFAAYMKGQKDILDPEFVKLVSDKKHLANRGKNGIIEVSKGNKKPYTKVRVEDIQPMDLQRFEKMKAGLERQGIKVIQDADGDAYLRAMGAEAMTLSDGSAVIFQSERIPSASAMFEEIIHTTQIRDNGMISEIGNNHGKTEYLDREIQANEKLLRYQEVYKLTDKDVESVKENLEMYYRLKKEVK